LAIHNINGISDLVAEDAGAMKGFIPLEITVIPLKMGAVEQFHRSKIINFFQKF
jgi:hypothetical protein